MSRVKAAYASSPGGDNELIRRHAGLIDRAARRISARSGGAVAPEDLWSAGALGLLEAAKRFDGERAVPFEAFAEHRIRGAMLDELRRLDHLPRRMRDDADKAAKAKSRLEGELGREPTLEEISHATGMDVEFLGSLDGLTKPPAPLLPELPVPDERPSAEQQLERASQSKKLAAAVSTLPERLQILLSLHYVEGLTYREIGKVLEVTEARVCQLHTEAVGKLRAVLSQER